MNNYIELKEKLERLNLEIKEIEEKILNIIETLYKAKEQYKEEFRVLPREITKNNIDKLPTRLEILKEEFEESNLEETTKQRIINTITKMKKELEINIEQLGQLTKEQEKTNNNIKEREEQLKEKDKKLEQNQKNKEKLNYDKKIVIYKEILNNDEVDFRIKEEVKQIIDNLIEEKEKLSKEEQEILEDNQIIDELSMFRFDTYIKNKKEEQMEKPKEETKEEEKEQEKEIKLELLEINKPWNMFSITESDNNKPLLFVKENDEELVEVTNIKPAKEKLINFANKNQLRIGVLFMSIAIVTVLAEPISLLAVPALPAVTTVNKELKKILKK